MMFRVILIDHNDPAPKPTVIDTLFESEADAQDYAALHFWAAGEETRVERKPRLEAGKEEK